MDKITVSEEKFDCRLDIYLSEKISDISRSGLKNRLDYLSVNGEPARLSRKIRYGDVIEYNLKKSIDTGITAEKIDLDVIYEDDNVIVLNKPQGMVVHPAAGNYSGTMAQGILYRLNEEENLFDEDDSRPGIVHRLDKDTSGVIIVAKNPSALEFLSRQFRERKTDKKYIAVINGRLPENKGIIKSQIGRDKRNRKRMTWKTEKGRNAETEYKVLKCWEKRSLVVLKPRTGRTHQLRVHMLMMKTPITGDPLYSGKTGGYNLMLHAYKLRITLPGKKTPDLFRAPLPYRFKEFILNQENTD